MYLRQKSLRIGMAFVAVLMLGGLVLMYNGHDAVVLATEKKEGILTAEQVKLSFDSVGGRLILENVQEAQEVKKGDVIMQLDSTDVDLSLAKVKAQIAQLNAQIASMSGSMGISYAKASTDEQESFRQIDQQRAAVAAARAVQVNDQLDYERKQALVGIGAIARMELDNAQSALEVAEANQRQQEQLLAKLLAGANDTGNTDEIALPTIARERQEAGNKANDVESLMQQKKALEVQQQELEVSKDRLTLRAPEDGRILKILARQGEMVAADTPVILLESTRSYYDIYVDEKQAAGMSEGRELTGRTVAGGKKVPGTIRLITKAPGFADLKQTREKGQADLTAFQVRIYIQPQDGVQTGMTIEVDDGILKR